MAHILLIDDEQLIREFLRIALEAWGHVITEARNGCEGLQHYHAALPDLVITDILMPEKDGLTLIHELRRDFPLAKIIAVSGCDQKLREAVEQGGVQRAFHKPLCLRKLYSAVEELVSS